MNLPDDLTDLERDLAARSRPEPSANLRPRVLSAVARELAQPATSNSYLPSRRSRPRQLLIATGLAASIAVVLTLWRSSVPPHQPSPPYVPFPPVTLPSPVDLLTT